MRNIDEQISELQVVPVTEEFNNERRNRLPPIIVTIVGELNEDFLPGSLPLNQNDNDGRKTPTYQ